MNLARNNLENFYFEGDNNCEYDNDLLKIEHYKNHPEMLPFVGKDYNKHEKRVLLIGESHYLSNENKRDVAKDFEKLNWYDNALSFSPSDDGNVFYKDFENYATRHVVNRYISPAGKNFKGSNGMFNQPINAYYGKAEHALMHNFAFMNFYQRPAFEYGKSIANIDRDNEIATKTLIRVIDVLKPSLIVFLSTKAFNNFEKYYKKNYNEKLDENIFHKVPHPTCAWWYREYNGYNNYGLCKFKEILENAWGKYES